MDRLIGTLAVVKGNMDGEGFVYVSGELWRARCRQRLQDGEKVQIESYDGLTLNVRPARLATSFAAGEHRMFETAMAILGVFVLIALYVFGLPAHPERI